MSPRFHVSLLVFLFSYLLLPFANLDASEPRVSFRREVIPVLTKYGCATGACHGSPSGKGGFRLSLRGFDPELDQTTVIRESLGRRVNSSDSTASLLLRKPLMEIAHGGGRKLRDTDPGYQILNRWIAQGCPVDTTAGTTCRELTVTPSELKRTWPDTKFSLQVNARFDDGFVRDVTALVDFNSTDDTVATVSKSDEVHGIAGGDATIVVRYLDQLAIAPVTILKPVAGFAWTNPPANNEIDRLLNERQKLLQIVPSELCSDGEFIRRLYLDVLGTLPTPDETRGFLADQFPTKRTALIDRVLERDEYAQYWAIKWGDLLQVKASKLSPVGVAKFHEWLVRMLRDNRPYEQFAIELLTASGSTYENPPASFYRAATDVDSCSEATSQVFLGIRIQCAKCHNHPYERWTQDHYYGLGAFFRRVQRRPDRNSEEITIWTSDTGEATHLRTGQPILPLVPFDGPISVAPGADRRVAFAKWLTSSQNPFFAKVGVNRLWGHLLGRGLVDPVDDFRDSNPASHPELLDWMTREFVRSDAGNIPFDQKRMLKLILQSRTYQLSSQTNPFNERDQKLFSHANARMLSAEPMLDAICTVTGVDEKYAGRPAGTRAIELPSPDIGNDFLLISGRPARNTVCDCERTREPKLSQSLQLLGGDMIAKKLAQPQSRLARHLDRNRTRNDIAVQPPKSGLQLWLRADAGLLNEAGAEATDGEAVATWRDQSPLGRSVVQSQAALRPTLIVKGIRNRPALQFDGTDVLHDVSTNLLPTGAARTVMVVAQANETSGGGALFTFRRTVQVCALQQVLYSGTYYVYSDGVNSSGNSTIPNAIDAIRQPFVTAFASAAAGQKLVVWLNGQPQVVTQPGGVGPDSGSVGFTIGNREDHPQFGWQGRISEVLVYDRVLKNEELADLSRQLAARYSVDSPATPLIDLPTAESDVLDQAFVINLYITAFSREPSPDEVTQIIRHLHSVNDRREGLGDIIWAVLNSREFLFQH
ncbi:MAG: DUF1549 domain-containing protein [Planctomycetota bacterium]